jgi:hypothetical protein
MPEMGDLLREGSVTDPFYEVLNDGDGAVSLMRTALHTMHFAL